MKILKILPASSITYGLWPIILIASVIKGCSNFLSWNVLVTKYPVVEKPKKTIEKFVNDLNINMFLSLVYILKDIILKN